ncbi:hypothetical protein B0H63DRAFT_533831 [Podospora didyma]|uniref:Uncharacterized protein n=1 Tax=Podospora didyma TaxID=330526 RepID=A0AAE0U8Y8_9PEZI|nr:hypothetical protein B0H63DRAFT_533831 [Podospora didyma]
MQDNVRWHQGTGKGLAVPSDEGSPYPLGPLEDPSRRTFVPPPFSHLSHHPGNRAPSASVSSRGLNYSAPFGFDGPSSPTGAMPSPKALQTMTQGHKNTLGGMPSPMAQHTPAPGTGLPNLPATAAAHGNDASPQVSGSPMTVDKDNNNRAGGEMALSQSPSYSAAAEMADEDVAMLDQPTTPNTPAREFVPWTPREHVAGVISANGAHFIHVVSPGREQDIEAKTQHIGRFYQPILPDGTLETNWRLYPELKDYPLIPGTGSFDPRDLHPGDCAFPTFMRRGMHSMAVNRTLFPSTVFWLARNIEAIEGCGLGNLETESRLLFPPLTRGGYNYNSNMNVNIHNLNITSSSHNYGGGGPGITSTTMPPPPPPGIFSYSSRGAPKEPTLLTSILKPGSQDPFFGAPAQNPVTALGLNLDEETSALYTHIWNQQNQNWQQSRGPGGRTTTTQSVIPKSLHVPSVLPTTIAHGVPIQTPPDRDITKAMRYDCGPLVRWDSNRLAARELGRSEVVVFHPPQGPQTQAQVQAQARGVEGSGQQQQQQQQQQRQQQMENDDASGQPENQVKMEKRMEMEINWAKVNNPKCLRGLVDDTPWLELDGVPGEEEEGEEEEPWTFDSEWGPGF